MVWIETPTNPMLKLIDIQAVADVAHKTEVISMNVCSPTLSTFLVKGNWNTRTKSTTFGVYFFLVHNEGRTND